MLDLQTLLRELSPGSHKKIELVSGRRPRVVDGANVRHVGDEILNDEEVLDLCREHGGGKALDDLGDKPVRWVTQGPKGPVSVTVGMKGRDVVATFAAAVEPRRSTRPPRRLSTVPARRTDAEPARERRAITVADRRRATQKPPAPTAATSPQRARGATPAPTKRRSASAIPAAQPAGALKELCELARQRRATDIHLTAGLPTAMRIAGELREGKSPIDRAEVERVLAAVLPAQKKAELERTGGACFALTLGPELRVRINATQTHGGPKLAIRLVRPTPPTIASLGLPPEVEKATNQPQGLVLVVGPAGQGKTTTLAALVDAVNESRAVHVVMVEDPVEIPITSKRALVSQREVGTHAQSFHRALEGALRQDPDVVAIGELRDIETVRMALAASETGHLVIGTMNAPNARRAIERIIDVFPTAEQPQVRGTLAGALRLVVGQKLVRTADGSDRTALVEILPGSIALWNLIREDKTYQLPSLMQRGKALGIVRLEDSAIALRDKGVISKETADEVLEDADGASELARLDPGKPPAAHPPSEPGETDESALGGLWSRAGALFSRKGGPQ